ncbi:hypothetical protein [Sulfurimonas sp.]
MVRFIILLSLLFSSVYAVEMGKSGGCTLTQSGIIKVGYNNVSLKDFSYTMSAKSGGNFRKIFVGAQLKVSIPATSKTLYVNVLDYKPNKRIKGKPKRGIFITEFSYDGKKEIINMKYIYDAGIMKIYAQLDKNSLKKFGYQEKMKIWFETDVAYSFCHIK